MTTVTVWGGSSSTDWHTAANWTNGVPTTSLIASIPSAPSNQPNMSSDGTAHALQLDSGATLTGGSNITLYITGESAGETDAPPNGMAVNLDGAISGELSLNITTNATTSVDLNPTSGDVHDLTLASTGTSLIINSENTCTLTGDLTITKGKFNANSNNLSVAGTITVNSVAGGDAEIDIGDVVADCAKIAVESGDTITAAHSSNALTVDGNGIGTGRSIDFTGIISGTLDIICTHPNTTEADLSASSGVINHLTLNHASLVMKMNSSATLGKLTITAGEFSTVDSSGNSKDLTVTGEVSIAGTLTGNASAITIGKMLEITNGGTYNETSGTTLISGQPDGDYVLRNHDGGTYTKHTTGILKIARTSAAGTKYAKFGEDVYNDLILENTSSSSAVAIVGVMNLAGDLTVVEGELRSYGGTGAIDVDGHVSIESGGKFSTETSQLAAGGVNADFGSLTIASGGEYSATPLTTTLTGKNGSNYMLQNSGTFTHNKGTVRFEADTSSGTWYATSASNVEANSIKFYNLETVRTGSAGSYRFFVGGNSFYLVVLNNLTIGVNTSIYSSNGTSILRHYGPCFNIEGAAAFDNVKDVECGFITIGSAGELEFNDGDQTINCTGIRNLRGAAGISA
tara:strand:- start:88 stop:1974 length:1887 start_codon:yes stop_codon:yes gene_type:complete